MEEEVKFTPISPDFFMMATGGFHLATGNKTNGEVLCIVYGENSECWVGKCAPIAGISSDLKHFQFQFPKKTSRKLNEEEVRKYSSTLGVKITYSVLTETEELQENEVSKNEITFDPEAIAEKWINALISHDIETLLALYSDSVSYHSTSLMVEMPITEGKINRKVLLREYFDKIFNKHPSLTFVRRGVLSNHKSVFVEYTEKGANGEKSYLAEKLTIEDGQIVKSVRYHY